MDEISPMTDAEREERRAFIRKYQLWLCITFCIVWTTVSAYFQPDPTPAQTLRSFGIRVLEAAIVWLVLSRWLLGKGWDASYKRRDVTR